MMVTWALFSCQGDIWNLAKQNEHITDHLNGGSVFVLLLIGGEYRDRTGDLLHAMQALSRTVSKHTPRKSCVNGYHLALIRYGRQAAHYDTVFRKRFGPSVPEKRKIFIPTWVYSCCVRHEENRSENCRIVFPQMGVSRMGYGYCNIIYGQIRQKSLIFFVYL